MNKKLIAPIVAAGAMLATSVGSTFALFTSKSSSEIKIQAGKVDVAMNISNFKTYSGEWNSATSSYDLVETETGTFSNGGTASIEDGILTLDKISPMDKVEFDVSFTNDSNIQTKIRQTKEIIANNGLFEGLKVTIDDEDFDGMTDYSQWTVFEPESSIEGYHVVAMLPEEAGNEFQEKICEIKFGIEAIQANAHVESLPEDAIGIYNANDLRLFAKYANESKMNGKTAILTENIDLEYVEWTQINGAGKSITFDGNGKTISNLKVSDGHNAGFFATAQGCTVKNVTFDGAEVDGVGRVGVVVGHGMCAYVDNVIVKNSKVTAHVTNNDDGDKAGALVGYLSGEPNAKVTGCTAENVTVEGYRDVGALVGYAGGTYTVTGNTVKNSTVVNNQLINYKNYATDAEFDANELIGEQGAAGTISDNEVTGTTVVRGQTINSASDLVYFGNKVNSGTNYHGKTVTLGADIDLKDVAWTPIGRTSRFEGTFDGANHTIKNLNSVLDSSTGTKYGNGLFGDITGGAVIKNLVMENALVKDAVENKGNVYGIVCGYAYGNVTFDNITVKDSRLEGFGKVGVILGMAADAGGTTTIKNCSISNTTVKGTYNVGYVMGLAQNTVDMANITLINNSFELGRADASQYTSVTDTLSCGVVLNNANYWVYTDTVYYAGFAQYYNAQKESTLNSNPSITVDGYPVDALA